MNLYTCILVSDQQVYDAVAGDRMNLVINIQTKEGNTNLDIFKRKRTKIAFQAVATSSH